MFFKIDYFLFFFLSYVPCSFFFLISCLVVYFAHAHCRSVIIFFIVSQFPSLKKIDSILAKKVGSALMGKMANMLVAKDPAAAGLGKIGNSDFQAAIAKAKAEQGITESPKKSGLAGFFG